MIGYLGAICRYYWLMGVSLLQKYSKPFSMSCIYPKSPVFPCYEAFIVESGKRVNLIIFYSSDESNLLFYAPKKRRNKKLVEG